MYTIWFPVVSVPNYAFHPDLILIFDNWINWGTMIYAEDTYAWVVAAIFPAWVFKGFEVSMHLSEETKQASKSVATGMWTGALVTYLIGIPVLVLMVACINDIRILIRVDSCLMPSRSISSRLWVAMPQWAFLFWLGLMQHWPPLSSSCLLKDSRSHWHGTKSSLKAHGSGRCRNGSYLSMQGLLCSLMAFYYPW
jgi:amino acid transporter